MTTNASSMDPIQTNNTDARSAAAPTAGTSSKNLLEQLPAGAVLAFQALAATFTNQGHCFPSNRWLSVGLVTFLSSTCIFFSFTDTVRDSTTGKLHKGVALPGRLHIVNLSRKDQKSMSSELKKRGLKTVDWVHATNQGKCYRSNLLLTAGLVTFLSATCVFSSFTDSVQDRHGKMHKGVALPRRLRIINLSKKDEAQLFTPSSLLKDKRLKTLDWVHAFFSAVVFLTIAGSDVGLQDCFFPKANDDTKQLLKNLPLGMAVMSSFVFMIFPATRNGMCFVDSDYSVIQTTPSDSWGGDEEGSRKTLPQQSATAPPSHDQSYVEHPGS